MYICPKDIARRSIKKILIIGIGSLGDNLLITPSLKVIRDAFPQAQIDFVAGPGSRGFAEGHPWFSRCIIYDKSKGIRVFMKDARQTRYDLIVDFKNSYLSFVCRSKYRMTFFIKDFFSDKRHIHESRRVLNFFAPFFNSKEDVRLWFPVTAAEKVNADKFIQSLGIADTDVKIAFNPGAKTIQKCWPKEKFIEAGKYLVDKYGAKILITGLAGEKDLTGDIARAIGRNAINLAGKTTVRQLSALLEKMDILVTNDTGTMHLACAVGCPVVAIFGPTNPDRYGPLFGKNAMVRNSVNCLPCNEGEKCGKDYACIKGITVEKVVKACSSLLDKGNDIWI